MFKNTVQETFLQEIAWGIQKSNKVLLPLFKIFDLEIDEDASPQMAKRRLISAASSLK